MTADDQSETIAFLEHGNSASGGASEVVRTHISLVFLVADRAFKLKRAVRFPYLDFSTAERRRAACEAELELNRRTAPGLYLAVRRIGRAADGKLAFDGPGPLVDAVVEMRRFDQDGMLDRMAQRGALTPGVVTALAHRLAAFHRDAAVSQDHGGASGISAVIEGNDRSLRATSLVSPTEAESLVQAFRWTLARHAGRLDARRAAGRVRRCHGDLILRNICLLDGEPTLFDCIEFDDALATIDVLYDLAFLLMDLWHRDQRGLANLVLNRYLDECDETDGLVVLPLFMAIRACIRAHVTAAQAAGLPTDQATPLLQDARAYFDLAQSLLPEAPPALLAVGGFSGSGKSTVAAALAAQLGPPPGARILSSDRIRKHLHGVAATERLPASAYCAEVSERVYSALRKQAAETLAAGWTVIADAVFDKPSERTAVEDVARAQVVPFLGVWLDAPSPILLARIAERRHDPSDATASVLQQQLERSCGEIAWRRLDAQGGIAGTRDAILSGLGWGGHE